MDIRGKLPCDVVAVTIKANESHDGKDAMVDIECGVRQEDAVARFGQDFADMAFSTLKVIEAKDENETDSYGFLVDTIKPNRRVVIGKHRLQIGEHQIDADPKLRAIKTEKSEPRVVVRIRFHVETSKKQLLSYIQDHVGSMLTVDFEPAQGQFDFVEKPRAHTPVIDGTGVEASAH